MSVPSPFVRYIPLLLGIVILGVIVLIAPWAQIAELIDKIPVLTFLILATLSIIYYGSKTIRFWYILRLLDIRKPLPIVSLLYLSGQPFSLLPAGELYRTILLKKHLGVSMSKSSPSVTIQGLVEAIVLLSFSIIGAFLIGQNQFLVAVVGFFLILVVITLQRGWLSRMDNVLTKLPYVSIDKDKYQKFIASHQELLTPRALTSLLLLSMIPVFSGVGILYISARAIGFDVSFIESLIGYSLPVIVSGLSFLPGGLGVSEGGTIGLLQLFGATAAAAITIALLIRIFTLVSGLLYGLIAQIILHIRKGEIT